MSFLDDVTAQGPARCGVALVLAKLRAPLRDEVVAALDMSFDAAPHARIAESLRKRGHRLSSQTVSRHRRGICACAEMEGAA